MEKMKIGLLGHGVVGSGVRKIVDGGETEAVRGLEISAILVRSEAECTDPRCTTDPQRILNDPEIAVVAECMGGLEPAHTYVRQALRNGKHAVTSNKKMLAAYAGELLAEAQQHGVHLCYEASCGGGIPWMANLSRIRRIDGITSFSGIFNGTTNYILSRMTAEGADFDTMLAEAQKNGYAERDPSDDIDGTDAACKVALSCMHAYDLLVKPEDVTVFGIRNIRAEDIRRASEAGRVCRLIGRSCRQDGTVSAMVLPVFLKRGNLAAAVPLNFNLAVCSSPTLGEAAFYGQGAGSLPTAHAVVQDLLDVRTEVRDSGKQAGTVDNQLYVSRFYIRTAKPVVFAAITERNCGEGGLITGKVSLTEVAQYVRTAEDAGLFLAEVADD